jgi:hypothetical protein
MTIQETHTDKDTCVGLCLCVSCGLHAISGVVRPRGKDAGPSCCSMLPPHPQLRGDAWADLSARRAAGPRQKSPKTS